MSVFDEQSNPYEILIRFDPATGMLKGAHQIRINVVTRDGVVIQSQEGDAQPIDLNNFSASGLMSETLEIALQTNTQLQAELDSASEQIEALGRKNDALQAELDSALALAGQAARSEG